MRKYNHSGDEKLWATLAHLSIVPVVTLQGLGLFVTMFIFYFKRRTSPWLAFQTLQALTFQAIIFTLFLLLRLIPDDMLGNSNSYTSMAFWIQVGVIVVFMGAVMGAVRCAIGYNFRYPIIGNPIQRRFRVREE